MFRMHRPRRAAGPQATNREAVTRQATHRQAVTRPAAARVTRGALRAAVAGASLVLAVPAAALPPGPIGPGEPGEPSLLEPPTAVISPYPHTGGANIALAALGARVTGSSNLTVPPHAPSNLIDGRFTGSSLGDSGWLTAAVPWQRPWVSIALPGRYHVSTVWLRRSATLPSNITRATAILKDGGRRVGDGYLSYVGDEVGSAVAPTFTTPREFADEVRIEPGVPTNTVSGIGEVEVHTGQIGGPTVSFHDFSTDDGSIVARRWSFGDGATSTARYPQHTYGAPGHYRVTLTVTDDHGLTDTTSMTQTVLAPPVVDVMVADGAAEGTPGLAIDRSHRLALDGPRVFAQREWSSVPAGVRVTSPTSVTFDNSGVYDLTYTMKDSAGLTAARTWRVTVTDVAPTVTVLRWGSGPIRAGQTAQFQFTTSDPSPADRAGLRCTLDHGDGRPVVDLGSCAQGRVFDVTYPLPGTYRMKVTATDPDGASGRGENVVTVE